MTEAPPARIIIIDDDQADAYIIRKAVIQMRLPIDVEVVDDGQTFVDRVVAAGPGGRGGPREMVLLDINMPRLNGFEILRALAGAPRRMPVVMFSTSREQDDVDLAYDLGANGYVAKPMTIEAAGALVCALHAFWLTENIR